VSGGGLRKLAGGHRTNVSGGRRRRVQCLKEGA